MNFFSKSGIPIFNSLKQIEKSRKSFQSRSNISTQLYTGTWQIDILKPIGKGHFVIFKGNTATGKTSTTFHSAINFLAENSHNHVVYIGNKAETLKSKLLDSPNITLDSNLSIIDTSAGSISERLLAYKTGISLTNHFSSLNKEVLLILDDFYNSLAMETDVQNATGIPCLPWNNLKEAYSCSGKFEDSSVTTVLVTHLFLN